jgi:TctA family transporter
MFDLFSLDLITIVVIFSGIAMAVVSGLLPGIPAWICPFFLLPFVNDLSINQIVLFWIISVLGSQFFGTIASVTFGIPGESSTLIFNHYTKYFSLSTKQIIIRRCADSGAIASVISLFAVLFGQSLYGLMLPLFGKTVVVFSILILASFVVIIFTKSYFVNFLLFTVGVFIVPKSNIALPEFFIKLGSYTYDISLVSFIIGLILIPKLFYNPEHSNTKYDKLIEEKEDTKSSTALGTTVGILCGFLPGPTATISSVLSFKFNRGNLFSKIVSTSAADHSAIPIGAFLFLYLQIPLAIDAVVVNSILVQKEFNVLEFAKFENLVNIFSLLFASLLILWILARKTYKAYSHICKLDMNKIFIVTIIGIMFYLDFLLAGGSYSLMYVGWVSLFGILGIVLHKYDINPMPLIIGFILGDNLIWSSYQMINY